MHASPQDPHDRQIPHRACSQTHVGSLSACHPLTHLVASPSPDPTAPPPCACIMHKLGAGESAPLGVSGVVESQTLNCRVSRPTPHDPKPTRPRSSLSSHLISPSPPHVPPSLIKLNPKNHSLPIPRLLRPRYARDTPASIASKPNLNLSVSCPKC